MRYVFLCLAALAAAPGLATAVRLSVLAQPSEAESSLHVALSPDGRQLYTAEYAAGGVQVFDRELATERLSWVEDEPGTEDGGVAVSADGLHVYATAPGDDSIGIFARDASTGAIDRIGVFDAGAGAPPELDEPRALAITADGAHVYVACAGGVLHLARDAADGTLSFVAVTSGANGAAALVLGPRDEQLYVTTTADDALLVYARDAEGGLTLVDTEADGVDDVTGLDQVRALAIPPDGGHVYAIAQNHLTRFTRDAEGLLDFAASSPFGVGNGAGIAATNDRLWLFATGTGDQEMITYSRDAPSGALTLEASVGLNAPACVQDGEVMVAPAGRGAYTASSELCGGGGLQTVVLVDAPEPRAASLAALTGLAYCARRIARS